MYLSIIRDLFDNSIVAYKTGTSQTVNLVLDTIRLAMQKEKKVAAELQLHSDQGSQYTSQAYDSLDQELKDIIATCAKANLLEAYGENAYQDAVATDKMIKDEGVTLTYFSDEDLATIENARNEVYNEMAAKNADFAKIAQSQMDYFKTMTYYQEDFLGDYSTTSIPSAYPNLG